MNYKSNRFGVKILTCNDGNAPEYLKRFIISLELIQIVIRNIAVKHGLVRDAEQSIALNMNIVRIAKIANLILNSYL
jgi:hypothetical protein